MTVQPGPSDEDPTRVARSPRWRIVPKSSLEWGGEAKPEEDEQGYNQGEGEDPYGGGADTIN